MIFPFIDRLLNPIHASLPMYDLPGIQPAVKAWWKGLQKHFIQAGITEVPRQLNRPTNLYRHWKNKNLLFSQTCGYPLLHTLKNNVSLIATPNYDAGNRQAGHYFSYVLIKEESPIQSLESTQNLILAANGQDSQSGWNCAEKLLQTELNTCIKNHFKKVKLTGSHMNSIQAVKYGKADICFIDSVLYALLEKHQPETLNGLKVLTTTPETPGLPYITGENTPQDGIQRLRDGINAALNDSKLDSCRGVLLLTGMSQIPFSDYEAAILF